ncbi:MAG: cytochrome c biogenesis protein CcsA [Fimbriimonadaceae bacterium]|nr:cytochrome c biogenesis protein CcsA [Fimbriimonadaceae bacterium]
MEDKIPVLPSPPDWSLMVGSLGRFCVWFGVVAFIVAIVVWGFGEKSPKLRTVAIGSFVVGCLSLFGAFASLAVLFAENRFEFAYVWGHADTKNALQYRIAGIWSGQEGSFLLWGCCAAIFGLLTVHRTGAYRRWYTIGYSAFLGSICGILSYETPFNLNLLDGKPIVPEEGVGLAPSLQNYWVTIHPPTIFLGFGSLTVLFCLAFAALATKDLKGWVPIVRPWALVSLAVLGLGLCMGGFWAYETLGWGGFWMWDPVENVSFVPWVLCAAFIHGLMVQTTKNKWIFSNLIMGAVPFLAFVYGTFLTRSGFLADTSVHSFAEMNSTALKVLLGLLVTYAAGFTGLWLWRMVQARGESAPAEPAKGLHREGFFRWGSVLLAGIGLATAIGMSVPFFMAVAGRPPKVVAEEVYHQILPFLFLPLILAMAAGPFVSWRGEPTSSVLKKLYGAFCVSFGMVGMTMMLVTMTPLRNQLAIGGIMNFPMGQRVYALPWMLILIGLCYFAIVANVIKIAELWRRSKLGTMSYLTHFGVAVLMLGLIVSRGFETKTDLFVQEGTPGQGLGYTVTYKGQTSNLKDRDNKVLLEVAGQGHTFTARPGLYYVTAADGAENPMVWPHIERYPFHDVYLALHPRQTEATDTVALHPGESFRFDRYTFTYESPTRQGEPGMAGTQFGAKVTVHDGHGHTTVTPGMRLAAGGPEKVPAPIGNGLYLTMEGMDVSAGSVTFQVHFTNPIYPIEMFYKPMTILVWLGTGIMTLAGLAAAYYRRRVPVLVPANPREHRPGDRVPTQNAPGLTT